REDEELKRSVAACREYATKKRDVPEDELQPTLSPGEAAFATRMWEFKKHKGPGSDTQEEGSNEDNLPNQEAN
ncbi:4323_t:CDS:2, partial [Acaulospora colombiana]